MPVPKEGSNSSGQAIEDMENAHHAAQRAAVANAKDDGRVNFGRTLSANIPDPGESVAPAPPVDSLDMFD